MESENCETAEIASVALRPEIADDAPFLFDLYASTRTEELDSTGWDGPARNAFLQMQHRCQQESYRGMFSLADFSILTLKEHSIGRVVIQRTFEEIRIVDIALLPEYRRKGIGTLLMKRLMSEAEASRKSIRLHTVPNSRESRWYERLGFKKTGEAGFRDEMQWQRHPKV
jgi:ribosomal protein S18 acetylase RimI-like enzyme